MSSQREVLISAITKEDVTWNKKSYIKRHYSTVR